MTGSSTSIAARTTTAGFSATTVRPGTLISAQTTSTARPARLFVRGANVWREEDEWPLPRAKYVPYYLHKGPSGSVTSLNDGALGTQAPAADGGSTSYTYPDWQWTNGVAGNGPDGRPD